MNSDQALAALDKVLKKLPELVLKHDWESLVINRRKPFTYRAHTQVDDLRVCLHRFEVCDEQEAFLHPHPWPGAFIILKGRYLMTVGKSPDRFTPPVEVAKFELSPGTKYTITDPLTWHSVTPLEECLTVMINGAPWAADVAHTEVRTTKGKDLQAMTPDELDRHFGMFGTAFVKTVAMSWLKELPQ
jgi:hypothetical protein